MRGGLVIFDLDGTLLDTLDDLCCALNFALSKNGFAERTRDEVRDFVGNGIAKLVLRGMGSMADSEAFDRVYSDFCSYYAEHLCDRTHPYEGITALLCKLKKSGCKIAVVSNKADFALKRLCKVHFDGLLDACLGAREDMPKKPAPDMILHVIKELGAEFQSTVYVGDSEVDIAASGNAGLRCIAVDWGFRERDLLLRCGPLCVCSCCDELYEAITKQI